MCDPQVFTLSFPQGMEPLPEGVDLEAAIQEVYVTAHYTHALGRTLYCSRPLQSITHRRSVAALGGASPAQPQLVYSVSDQVAAHTLDAQSDPRRRQLQAGAILARPYPITGKIAIIVYVVSMCTAKGTQPYAATPAQIRDKIFYSGDASLPAFYSQCSSGKTTLDTDASVVMTIDLPCR